MLWVPSHREHNGHNEHIIRYLPLNGEAPQLAAQSTQTTKRCFRRLMTTKHMVEHMWKTTVTHQTVLANQVIETASSANGEASQLAAQTTQTKKHRKRHTLRNTYGNQY